MGEGGGGGKGGEGRGQKGRGRERGGKRNNNRTLLINHSAFSCLSPINIPMSPQIVN